MYSCRRSLQLPCCLDGSLDRSAWLPLSIALSRALVPGITAPLAALLAENGWLRLAGPDADARLTRPQLEDELLSLTQQLGASTPAASQTLLSEIASCIVDASSPSRQLRPWSDVALASCAVSAVWAREKAPLTLHSPAGFQALRVGALSSDPGAQRPSGLSLRAGSPFANSHSLASLLALAARDCGLRLAPSSDAAPRAASAADATPAQAPVNHAPSVTLHARQGALGPIAQLMEQHSKRLCIPAPVSGPRHHDGSASDEAIRCGASTHGMQATQVARDALTPEEDLFAFAADERSALQGLLLGDAPPQLEHSHAAAAHLQAVRRSLALQLAAGVQLRYIEPSALLHSCATAYLADREAAAARAAAVTAAAALDAADEAERIAEKAAAASTAVAAAAEGSDTAAVSEHKAGADDAVPAATSAAVPPAAAAPPQAPRFAPEDFMQLSPLTAVGRDVMSVMMTAASAGVGAALAGGTSASTDTLQHASALAGSGLGGMDLATFLCAQGRRDIIDAALVAALVDALLCGDSYVMDGWLCASSCAGSRFIGTGTSSTGSAGAAASSAHATDGGQGADTPESRYERLSTMLADVGRDAATAAAVLRDAMTRLFAGPEGRPRSSMRTRDAGGAGGSGGGGGGSTSRGPRGSRRPHVRFSAANTTSYFVPDSQIAAAAAEAAASGLAPRSPADAGFAGGDEEDEDVPFDAVAEALAAARMQVKVTQRLWQARQKKSVLQAALARLDRLATLQTVEAVARLLPQHAIVVDAPLAGLLAALQADTAGSASAGGRSAVAGLGLSHTADATAARGHDASLARPRSMMLTAGAALIRDAPLAEAALPRIHTSLQSARLDTDHAHASSDSDEGGGGGGVGGDSEEVAAAAAAEREAAEQAERRRRAAVVTEPFWRLCGPSDLLLAATHLFSDSSAGSSSGAMTTAGHHAGSTDSLPASGATASGSRAVAAEAFFSPAVPLPPTLAAGRLFLRVASCLPHLVVAAPLPQPLPLPQLQVTGAAAPMAQPAAAESGGRFRGIAVGPHGYAAAGASATAATSSQCIPTQIRLAPVSATSGASINPWRRVVCCNGDQPLADVLKEALAKLAGGQAPPFAGGHPLLAPRPPKPLALEVPPTGDEDGGGHDGEDGQWRRLFALQAPHHADGSDDSAAPTGVAGPQQIITVVIAEVVTQRVRLSRRRSSSGVLPSAAAIAAASGDAGVATAGASEGSQEESQAERETPIAEATGMLAAASGSSAGTASSTLLWSTTQHIQWRVKRYTQPALSLTDRLAAAQPTVLAASRLRLQALAFATGGEGLDAGAADSASGAEGGAGGADGAADDEDEDGGADDSGGEEDEGDGEGAVEGHHARLFDTADAAAAAAAAAIAADAAYDPAVGPNGERAVAPGVAVSLPLRTARRLRRLFRRSDKESRALLAWLASSRNAIDRTIAAHSRLAARGASGNIADADADAEDGDSESGLRAEKVMAGPLPQRRHLSPFQHFCPVSLVDEGLLVRGRPAHAAAYRGFLFAFADAHKLATFMLNPRPYLQSPPALPASTLIAAVVPPAGTVAGDMARQAMAALAAERGLPMVDIAAAVQRHIDAAGGIAAAMRPGFSRHDHYDAAAVSAAVGLTDSGSSGSLSAVADVAGRAASASRRAGATGPPITADGADAAVEVACNAAFAAVGQAALPWSPAAAPPTTSLSLTLGGEMVRQLRTSGFVHPESVARVVQLELLMLVQAAAVPTRHTVTAGQPQRATVAAAAAAASGSAAFLPHTELVEADRARQSRLEAMRDQVNGRLRGLLRAALPGVPTAANDDDDAASGRDDEAGPTTAAKLASGTKPQESATAEGSGELPVEPAPLTQEQLNELALTSLRSLLQQAARVEAQRIDTVSKRLVAAEQADADAVAATVEAGLASAGAAPAGLPSALAFDMRKLWQAATLQVEAGTAGEDATGAAGPQSRGSTAHAKHEPIFGAALAGALGHDAQAFAVRLQHALLENPGAISGGAASFSAGSSSLGAGAAGLPLAAAHSSIGGRVQFSSTLAVALLPRRRHTASSNAAAVPLAAQTIDKTTFPLALRGLCGVDVVTGAHWLACSADAAPTAKPGLDTDEAVDGQDAGGSGASTDAGEAGAVEAAAAAAAAEAAACGMLAHANLSAAGSFWARYVRHPALPPPHLLCDSNSAAAVQPESMNGAAAARGIVAGGLGSSNGGALLVGVPGNLGSWRALLARGIVPQTVISLERCDADGMPVSDSEPGALAGSGDYSGKPPSRPSSALSFTQAEKGLRVGPAIATAAVNEDGTPAALGVDAPAVDLAAHLARYGCQLVRLRVPHAPITSSDESDDAAPAYLHPSRFLEPGDEPEPSKPRLHKPRSVSEFAGVEDVRVGDADEDDAEGGASASQRGGEDDDNSDADEDSDEVEEGAAATGGDEAAEESPEDAEAAAAARDDATIEAAGAVLPRDGSGFARLPMPFSAVPAEWRSVIGQAADPFVLHADDMLTLVDGPDARVAAAGIAWAAEPGGEGTSTATATGPLHAWFKHACPVSARDTSLLHLARPLADDAEGMSAVDTALTAAAGGCIFRLASPLDVYRFRLQPQRYIPWPAATATAAPLPKVMPILLLVAPAGASVTRAAQQLARAHSQMSSSGGPSATVQVASSVRVIDLAQLARSAEAAWRRNREAEELGKAIAAAEAAAQRKAAKAARRAARLAAEAAEAAAAAAAAGSEENEESKDAADGDGSRGQTEQLAEAAAVEGAPTGPPKPTPTEVAAKRAAAARLPRGVFIHALKTALHGPDVPRDTARDASTLPAPAGAAAAGLRGSSAIVMVTAGWAADAVSLRYMRDWKLLPSSMLHLQCDAAELARFTELPTKYAVPVDASADDEVAAPPSEAELLEARATAADAAIERDQQLVASLQSQGVPLHGTVPWTGLQNASRLLQKLEASAVGLLPPTLEAITRTLRHHTADEHASARLSLAPTAVIAGHLLPPAGANFFSPARLLSLSLAASMLESGQLRMSRFGGLCPVTLLRQRLGLQPDGESHAAVRTAAFEYESPEHAHAALLQSAAAGPPPLRPVAVGSSLYLLSSADAAIEFIRQPAVFMRQPLPDTHARISIAIAGPPCSGRSQLAQRIAVALGCVVITPESVVHDMLAGAAESARPAAFAASATAKNGMTARGTPASASSAADGEHGEQWPSVAQLQGMVAAAAHRGSELSPCIVAACIAAVALQAGASCRGFVLDGFPLHPGDLEALATAGVVPDRLVWTSSQYRDEHAIAAVGDAEHSAATAAATRSSSSSAAATLATGVQPGKAQLDQRAAELRRAARQLERQLQHAIKRAEAAAVKESDSEDSSDDDREYDGTADHDAGDHEADDDDSEKSDSDGEADDDEADDAVSEQKDGGSVAAADLSEHDTAAAGDVSARSGLRAANTSELRTAAAPIHPLAVQQQRRSFTDELRSFRSRQALLLRECERLSTVLHVPSGWSVAHVRGRVAEAVMQQVVAALLALQVEAADGQVAAVTGAPAVISSLQPAVVAALQAATKLLDPLLGSPAAPFGRFCPVTWLLQRELLQAGPPVPGAVSAGRTLLFRGRLYALAGHREVREFLSRSTRYLPRSLALGAVWPADTSSSERSVDESLPCRELDALCGRRVSMASTTRPGSAAAAALKPELEGCCIVCMRQRAERCVPSLLASAATAAVGVPHIAVQLPAPGRTGSSGGADDAERGHVYWLCCEEHASALLRMPRYFTAGLTAAASGTAAAASMRPPVAPFMPSAGQLQSLRSAVTLPRERAGLEGSDAGADSPLRSGAGATAVVASPRAASAEIEAAMLHAGAVRSLHAAARDSGKFGAFLEAALFPQLAAALQALQSCRGLLLAPQSRSVRAGAAFFLSLHLQAFNPAARPHLRARSRRALSDFVDVCTSRGMHIPHVQALPQLPRSPTLPLPVTSVTARAIAGSSASAPLLAARSRDEALQSQSARPALDVESPQHQQRRSRVREVVDALSPAASPLSLSPSTASLRMLPLKSSTRHALSPAQLAKVGVPEFSAAAAAAVTTADALAMQRTASAAASAAAASSFGAHAEGSLSPVAPGQAGAGIASPASTPRRLPSLLSSAGAATLGAYKPSIASSSPLPSSRLLSPMGSSRLAGAVGKQGKTEQ